MASAEARPEKRKGKTGDTPENGASYESFSWDQTVDEIDLKVNVGKEVVRGKQIKVNVSGTKLSVSCSSSGELKELLQGELSYAVKEDELTWTLSPGQYILVQMNPNMSCLCLIYSKAKPFAILKALFFLFSLDHDREVAYGSQALDEAFHLGRGTRQRKTCQRSSDGIVGPGRTNEDSRAHVEGASEEVGPRRPGPEGVVANDEREGLTQWTSRHAWTMDLKMVNLTCPPIL
jgi:hypothetical protein